MSRPQPPRPAENGAGYFSNDTIAAPASAFGGAIGVIRVSGPAAFSSLERLSPHARVAEHPFRTMVRARLSDVSGKPLDDALVVRFKGPDSFSGEDCVEYHLHGNILIASALMENLASLGVRRALPGEFSFRAVRNGKLTLPQASGIADLVDAANPTAIQLALEKLSGQQNLWISELGESLRTLTMQAETSIDFSDQDLGEPPLKGLIDQLEPLKSALKRLESSFERGSRIQEGIRVAFLGVPNSGKSSLFNALLGEDRSIVSDIPGTTRDVVGEHLTLRSMGAAATFRLEDTAGLRHTENPIESLGIQRSIRSAREADLVVFVVDASAASLEQAEAQWRAIEAPVSKTIGVLNKTDLVSEDLSTSLSYRLKEVFGFESSLPCSSVTGRGIDSLVQEMVEFGARWYRRDPGEFLLTRTEQLQAVREALDHLDRASNAAELDLFASDLRQTLHSLAPLIGITVADDILNAIFSRFCIGK